VINQKTPTAERGAQDYDSQCLYCHDAEAAKLVTPPDDVPGLLDAGLSPINLDSAVDG